MTDARAKPEFSRPISVADLPSATVERTIETTAEERHALAGRFGIEGIDRLTATMTIEPRQDGKLVIVRGQLSARVRQICVVTLDPFDTDLTEPFEERFVAPGSEIERPADREAVLDLEELMEAPEPLEGDVIDLGELVAQTLSLALDPYPRKPGVQFDTGDAAADPGVVEEGEAGARRPFEVLARLRKER